MAGRFEFDDKIKQFITGAVKSALNPQVTHRPMQVSANDSLSAMAGKGAYNYLTAAPRTFGNFVKYAVNEAAEQYGRQQSRAKFAPKTPLTGDWKQNVLESAKRSLPQAARNTYEEAVGALPTAAKLAQTALVTKGTLDPVRAGFFGTVGAGANTLFDALDTGKFDLKKGVARELTNVDNTLALTGLTSYTDPFTERLIKEKGLTNFFSKNAARGASNLFEDFVLSKTGEYDFSLGDAIASFLAPGILDAGASTFKGTARLPGKAITKIVDLITDNKFIQAKKEAAKVGIDPRKIDYIEQFGAEYGIKLEKNKKVARGEGGTYSSIEQAYNDVKRLKNQTKIDDEMIEITPTHRIRRGALLPYARGEYTGGNIDHPDVQAVRKFLEENPEYAAGGLAGVEWYQDEDGKWKIRYNAKKGAAGVAFMAGARKLPIDEAIYRLRAELDIAEAGARYTDGDNVLVSSKKSSFPDWLSDSLKHKRYINTILDYIDKGVVPKGKKQLQAIADALEEIDSRVGSNLLEQFDNGAKKVINYADVKIDPNQKLLPAGRLQTPEGSPIGDSPKIPNVFNPDNFYNKKQITRRYADNTAQPFVPKDAMQRLKVEAPNLYYSLWKQAEDRIQPRLPNVNQKASVQPQQISTPKLPSIQQQVPGTSGVNPKIDLKGPASSDVQKDIPLNNQIGSSQNSIPDDDLIVKLTNALKSADTARGTQEQLYSKARSQKLAQLLDVRERVAGEKGFVQELGALKGELPKARFESVRQNFTQENVDRLFDIVRKTNKLDAWEKVNAQVGLAKLLGEQGGSVPTKGELAHLHKVFGKDFTDTVLAKRPAIDKVKDLGMELYNLPRSFMAGALDLSATMMQNALFSYRHPILTAKNFVEQLKFFASEDAYRMSQAEIEGRSNYSLMKDGKLAITDLGMDPTKREEQFMSNLAEKIPGIGKVIRASGRAYTGFLNKMRADVFDQMVDAHKRAGGEVNADYIKSLSSFINAATGRGDLGSLERVAPVLGQGLFSARKLAATAQTLNPLFYIKAHPQVRKEALLTMLSFFSGATALTALASLGGAEVSTDPTNSDFGKIKIGNTRFNMYGPYQQIAVLMGRMIKGFATSSTTGRKLTLGDDSNPYAPNRYDLLQRFFEMKQHPTLSLMIGALRGKNNIGEDFNLPSEVLQRFLPMVISDAYDLYKEYGPAGVPAIIPAILGIPVQTYGSQYPVMETTKTGKPSIKLKNETNLAEDIVNTVTGKQKTNIPQNQWKGIVDTKKQEAAVNAARDRVRESAGEEIVGNKYVYFDEDTGSTKAIDLGFNIEPPQFTGNEMLDKRMASTYKSKLSSKAKDIQVLYERGVLSADEAEVLLRAIDQIYDSVSSSSGGGKKISVPKPPRAKVPAFQKPKTGTAKLPDSLKGGNIALPKLSNIKIKTPTQPRIDLESIRNPL